jgi:hypothetical protein
LRLVVALFLRAHKRVQRVAALRGAGDEQEEARRESFALAGSDTGPSEAIMANHPYTLAIVGHAHTYSHSKTKEIIIGNGGAPITGGASYGFGLIAQRADQALLVDVYNYQTMQADSSFHFAIKPDGTLTQ